MTENPLIVQVALAKDWFDAFQLTWIATFKIAARLMGIPVSDVAIEAKEPPIGWDERRALCRPCTQHFQEYGDPIMAGAWAMLAVDPAVLPAVREAEDEKTLSIALRGLASTIAHQPDLLSDGAFAKAVVGWRSLQRHRHLASRSGEHDPIMVARAVGSPMTIDCDEALDWASSVLERR